MRSWGSPWFMIESNPSLYRLWGATTTAAATATATTQQQQHQQRRDDDRYFYELVLVCAFGDYHDSYNLFCLLLRARMNVYTMIFEHAFRRRDSYELVVPPADGARSSTRAWRPGAAASTGTCALNHRHHPSNSINSKGCLSSNLMIYLEC